MGSNYLPKFAVERDIRSCSVFWVEKITKIDWLNNSNVFELSKNIGVNTSRPKNSKTFFSRNLWKLGVAIKKFQSLSLSLSLTHTHTCTNITISQDDSAHDSTLFSEVALRSKGLNKSLILYNKKVFLVFYWFIYYQTCYIPTDSIAKVVKIIKQILSIKIK